MNLSYQGPYGIVGIGKTGQALHELLRTQGVPEQDIAFYQDVAPTSPNLARIFTDSEKFLEDFRPRTLLVSPGYPLAKDWLRRAEAGGVLLSSELEYVASHLREEKIVGVTGSLGKSTTVSLIGEAARSLDPHAFVGGNLGVPLASYLSEVLMGRRNRAQWMVLELSSYQLERCRNLKLKGAVITYFSPNHLDRYQSLESYYDTKWNLVRVCEGPVVVNTRSAELARFAEKQSLKNLIGVDADHGPLRPDEIRQSALVGKHQWDNLSCASALIRALGWPWEAAWQRMCAFRGLPHRLQLLGRARGLSFVNDSKATTMESVLSAVASIEGLLGPEATLWLLLGGKDKNLPWKRMAPLTARRKVQTVLFGECRSTIARELALTAEMFAGLRSALESLSHRAKAGDWVLLSPGGTSLDEFRGFEERGQKFEMWIEELFGSLA